MASSMPSTRWDKYKMRNNSSSWLCSKSSWKSSRPKSRKGAKEVCSTLSPLTKRRTEPKTFTFARLRLWSTGFSENWGKNLNSTLRSIRNPMRSRSRSTVRRSRSSSGSSKPQNLSSTTLGLLRELSNCAKTKQKALRDLSQSNLSISWFCARTKTWPRKSLWRSPTTKSLVNTLMKKRIKKTKERDKARRRVFRANSKVRNRHKRYRRRGNTQTRESWCSFQWQSLQLVNQHFSRQSRRTTRTILST